MNATCSYCGRPWPHPSDDRCRAFPCVRCGTPTTFAGIQRCDGCYEVERRLADYLQSVGGRIFVLQALAVALRDGTEPLRQRMKPEDIKARLAEAVDDAAPCVLCCHPRHDHRGVLNACGYTDLVFTCSCRGFTRALAQNDAPGH